MKVLEVSSGREREAVIERLEDKEFRIVRAGRRFTFDWRLYKSGEVYKLIAYACERSFALGHNGMVFLKPKTGLIRHYIEEYGFFHFPLRTPDQPEGIMIIYNETSQMLIDKYLK